MFEKAHGVTFESYSVPVLFFFFFNLSAFCSFLKVRDIMCRVLPVIAGVVPKCTSRLKENTAVFMNK